MTLLKVFPIEIPLINKIIDDIAKNDLSYISTHIHKNYHTLSKKFKSHSNDNLFVLLSDFRHILSLTYSYNYL